MRLIGVLLLLWFFGGSAQAHRLTVNWEVRDGALIIEGLTDGAAAAGADVELRSASGEVLEAGLLDQAGVFRWPVTATGDVTVVVNAGPGHRRSLTVKGEALRPLRSEPGAGQGRVADHAHGSADGAFSLGLRVVVGITLLLALAAAWMSYRNTMRLGELERRWRDHEGRG